MKKSEKTEKQAWSNCSNCSSGARQNKNVSMQNRSKCSTGAGQNKNVLPPLLQLLQWSMDNFTQLFNTNLPQLLQLLHTFCHYNINLYINHHIYRGLYRKRVGAPGAAAMESMQ